MQPNLELIKKYAPAIRKAEDYTEWFMSQPPSDTLAIVQDHLDGDLELALNIMHSLFHLQAGIINARRKPWQRPVDAHGVPPAEMLLQAVFMGELIHQLKQVDKEDKE